MFLAQEPLFDDDIRKANEELIADHELTKNQWIKDFREVFCESPAGRRVLWWIIYESYIFRPFRQHNASAYGLEGKRELGQRIIDLIGAKNMLQSLIQASSENKRGDDFE